MELVLIERVPLLGPAALGANVTDTAQLADTLNVAPHVVLRKKSRVLVIPEIVRTAFPKFLIVTFNGALLVPTGWDPNFSALVETYADAGHDLGDKTSGGRAT